MRNVNDANISMTSSSCEFRKLFVIEIYSQESSKTARQFVSCEMKSNPENFVKKMFKLRSIELNCGCSC